MPLKFGHIAARHPDVQTVTCFYTDVLGFKVSDWMGDRFSFLRCGADHHTVNFVRYEEAKLHHIAFEVKDMAEVQRACDLLARNNIQLVWGPIRHVVGHNVAAYHRTPDDQRIEIFTEMDVMRDEQLGYFEPRPWHEDFPSAPRSGPPRRCAAIGASARSGPFRATLDRFPCRSAANRLNTSLTFRFQSYGRVSLAARTARNGNRRHPLNLAPPDVLGPFPRPSAGGIFLAPPLRYSWARSCHRGPVAQPDRAAVS